MREAGVVAGIFALAISLAPGAAAQTYLLTEEAQSHGLLNGTRASVGRDALPRHPALDGMAREQAVRMAERGDIYHNPNLSSDADATGLDWRRIGENVGVGPDVQSIHDAFVASSSHYENMIWPNYNVMGVGIVPGSDGRIYITHVFAELAVAAAPPPAPAAPPPPPPPPAPPPTPQPVLQQATKAPAAVPSPEPRSPEPNALAGGVVDMSLVFGVTDRASVDGLLSAVAGLGYLPGSPSVFTVAAVLLQSAVGASG